MKHDGAERPGAIERSGGLGWGRCPENRDDERDAQCRADLTRDGVQAGGRRVPGSRGRGDRRRGQIREQRAGAEPEQQDAGQPLADEVRGDADARNEPEDGRAPEQPAGDEHRPRPDSHDEVARRAGDGSGDERARRQREARLEHGVVPHRGEEEDVDQRVAVEAGAGEDRRGVGDAERPAAQQREVHDRRAMRRAAPDEDRSEHERSGERAQHPCVEPSPFRALHDRQDERRDRQRQHERAQQVGHPPAAGRTALDQMAAREHHRRDADRHVDEEHEPPVAGGDQKPAERGAEPGRPRGDRGQQRHAVRSALGRERVEHQGKRRRDEKRRPERLQHPERRQRAGRRGDRAQHRCDREQLEPADEDPAPPDEVGQASRRDEEGREDDVVGVEHPRQLRDRRLGIRARDIGEGDVDDRGVDERHRRAHRADRQHGARLRPAAATRTRRHDRWHVPRGSLGGHQSGRVSSIRGALGKLGCRTAIRAPDVRWRRNGAAQSFPTREHASEASAPERIEPLGEPPGEQTRLQFAATLWLRLMVLPGEPKDGRAAQRGARAPRRPRTQRVSGGRTSRRGDARAPPTRSSAPDSQPRRVRCMAPARSGPRTSSPTSHDSQREPFARRTAPPWEHSLGFGQPVYPDGDPRAIVLLEQLRRAATIPGWATSTSCSPLRANAICRRRTSASHWARSPHCRPEARRRRGDLRDRPHRRLDRPRDRGLRRPSAAAAACRLHGTRLLRVDDHRRVSPGATRGSSLCRYFAIGRHDVEPADRPAPSLNDGGVTRCWFRAGAGVCMVKFRALPWDGQHASGQQHRGHMCRFWCAR